MVQWSESLTTKHEVTGSIPGPTVGIFLEGEDSRGDHGLGRLVEFRFKAHPGTTSSSITTHTPSGQRNCASWASQPQTSVTLLACPGGRTTKFTKDMWWHWRRRSKVQRWNLHAKDGHVNEGKTIDNPVKYYVTFFQKVKISVYKLVFS